MGIATKSNSNGKQKESSKGERQSSQLMKFIEMKKLIICTSYSGLNGLQVAIPKYLFPSPFENPK